MKAIIDLGTNTFHLLVANLIGGDIQVIEKLQIPVKIGEGGINRQRISDEAFQRGINALQTFSGVLKKYNVREVKAFGTSAMRDAENGSSFIREAEALGILIEPISGDREALLIYEGVCHSMSMPDENVLVMDIGGGSVEFIIGCKSQILWKRSFKLGAARLLEMFHKHNPMTAAEEHDLVHYIEEQLQPLWDALIQFPAKTMIGSAGSFETLVDVLVKDFNENCLKASPHAYQIKLTQVHHFIRLMKQMDTHQLSLLKGMATFRIDMIAVAAVLMEVVIHKASISKVIASEYALKEGMLFEGG